MDIEDFIKQGIQQKLKKRKVINKRDYYTIERHCRVAGLFYHRYEYYKYLDEVEDLVAVFKPNNEYDKNAIAIYGGEHFIGYVPRGIAKKIAPLPDFVKDDLILDLKCKDDDRCTYDILVPRKYVKIIPDIPIYHIPKSTLKQKIIEWLGLDEIEYNTTFKLFLGVISIALLFVLFLICAVDN